MFKCILQTVPSWFVEDHQLYDFRHAQVHCGDFNKEMDLICYPDIRHGDGVQSLHVVIKGDWRMLKAANRINGKRDCRFLLEHTTPDNDGTVTFAVNVI